MPMRVRKAVFPAAGLGTRFLPATKAQPKEMLPLVDKPIIQYGVEEAVAAGCDQIIIVTGRGKQAIEDHFDVSYELEKMLEERGKTDLLQIVRQISDLIHIAYVRQKEALGLGHAVLTARELVGNEPFAVLLADDVIDAEVPCLKQLMNVFEKVQCSVLATQVVEGPGISAYGVLDAKPVPGTNGKLYEVSNLVEKPRAEDAPSNLAVIGRYILTPTVFETLSDIKAGAGGELQLTDGLRALLQKEKIYGYVFEGKRHDTGDKLGFLKATVEFALKRPDLGGPLRQYLKTLVCKRCPCRGGCPHPPSGAKLRSSGNEHWRVTLARTMASRRYLIFVAPASRRLSRGHPALGAERRARPPPPHPAPSVIFSFLDFSSTLLASFSLCASSFRASGSLDSPRICAARIPAFVAPGLPMATVATGMPAGICTVASKESIPCSEVDGIGTPMTGSVVCAAITPARCAAPPAPAMITRIPRAAALRAYSAVRSGERCADVTSISYSIPNSSSAFADSRMMSRSESLPITIETLGFALMNVLD